MKFDTRKAVMAAGFLFSVISLSLWGQESNMEASQAYLQLVEKAYGQDQELVNGMQYYNKHPRSLGHPYLLEGWAHQGSVTIRRELYDPVWLKYDIFAQQVEVDYRTSGGADNTVILVGDRVDEFTIGSYRFKRMKLEEDLSVDQSQFQFYQVLGRGRMIWYIRWNKKLVPVSGDSRFIEEFSTPKRTYLMELDGSLSSFQNKKSFIRIFPKAVQKNMRRLMNKNHLLIRSASTEQLELFILAAVQLLDEGGNK